LKYSEINIISKESSPFVKDKVYWITKQV